MLNFRNTNIAFLFTLMFLVGFDLIASVSLWLYLLLAFAYSGILFYGCYFIQSGFFMPVICSGPPDKKQIALSFDDGPAAAYTSEILQVLKEHNVKAAFFCIGSRIRGYERLFRRLHEEGHVIGNHSYSHHVLFDLFSSAKMKKELQMTDDIMEKVAGLTPNLFRPPYGVVNPNVKKATISGRYTAIGWNVRSMDTVIKDEQKLLRRVKKSLKPGAIFLFHDTSKATLSILPSFIEHVKEMGYEIVRLDKMLHLEAYA